MGGVVQDTPIPFTVRTTYVYQGLTFNRYTDKIPKFRHKQRPTGVDHTQGTAFPSTDTEGKYKREARSYY